MEKFGSESAPKVTKKKNYKDTLKASLRDQQSPRNILHRIEQSYVASSEKEQISMKRRESVKLKEIVENAETEPMDHHQR